LDIWIFFIPVTCTDISIHACFVGISVLLLWLLQWELKTQRLYGHLWQLVLQEFSSIYCRENSKDPFVHARTVMQHNKDSPIIHSQQEILERGHDLMEMPSW